PVNLTLDEDGNKIPRFKVVESPDGRLQGWKNGDYPTDPEEIARRWEGFDGIAINTGRSGLVGVDIDTSKGKDGHAALKAAGINPGRSGLVVVDIDTSKGKDGQAALKAAGVSLPEPLVRVRSWSGGEHWYYRAGDTRVPCSQSELADGVDIRADGGVIFAPPTAVGEAQYRWLGRVPPVQDLPLFPEGIAKRLAAKAPKTRSEGAQRPARELTPREKEIHQRRAEDALQAISELSDGKRHAGLLRWCPVVFGVADLLGESPEEYVSLIRDAYQESGGVDWESEERTVRDCIAYVQEHPYELPELPTSRYDLRHDDPDYIAEFERRMRLADLEQDVRKARNPFRVASLSDDDVIPFGTVAPAGNWVLDRILLKGETAILFGRPEAGKSLLAIDLAMGMACGTEAWGLPVDQGKVLYLAGEGITRLPNRREGWMKHHGAVPEPSD